MAFCANLSVFPQAANAQEVMNLPAPGIMITPSSGFNPAILRGIKIYPEEPFRFDFIVDPGQSESKGKALENESSKLIKYFLASLTVPEDDLWVNLSPYEGDRIIPKAFSYTEMGRDLLAQDYLLKQLTASLMYPEDELGKDFWDKVYRKASQLYGSTEIPINTFNKVWIVPEKAVVYQHDNTAFVTESHLKVMLEQDYLSMRENVNSKTGGTDHISREDVAAISDVSSQVIRDVILPAIEKEVNEGQNFAQLRQIYHSLILAAWFKRTLKESLLGHIYMDQNKVRGIDLEDKTVKDKIYQQYVQAFEKGVYNYIREDIDPVTEELIPRKYFSGGFTAKGMVDDSAMMDVRDVEQNPSGWRAALNKLAVTASTGLLLFAINASPIQAREQVRPEQNISSTDSSMLDAKRAFNALPQFDVMNWRESWNQRTRVAKQLISDDVLMELDVRLKTIAEKAKQRPRLDDIDNKKRELRQRENELRDELGKNAVLRQIPRNVFKRRWLQRDIARLKSEIESMDNFDQNIFHRKQDAINNSGLSTVLLQIWTVGGDAADQIEKYLLVDDQSGMLADAYMHNERIEDYIEYLLGIGQIPQEQYNLYKDEYLSLVRKVFKSVHAFPGESAQDQWQRLGQARNELDEFHQKTGRVFEIFIDLAKYLGPQLALFHELILKTFLRRSFDELSRSLDEQIESLSLSAQTRRMIVDLIDDYRRHMTTIDVDKIPELVIARWFEVNEDLVSLVIEMDRFDRLLDQDFVRVLNEADKQLKTGAAASLRSDFLRTLFSLNNFTQRPVPEMIERYQAFRNAGIYLTEALFNFPHSVGELSSEIEEIQKGKMDIENDLHVEINYALLKKSIQAAVKFGARDIDHKEFLAMMDGVKQGDQ
jgi:hypothetical protein